MNLSTDIFAIIKGSPKGTAIVEICNKLNLDVEKTIAFGDQELDVSMI